MWFVFENAGMNAFVWFLPALKLLLFIWISEFMKVFLNLCFFFLTSELHKTCQLKYPLFWLKHEEMFILSELN